MQICNKFETNTIYEISTVTTVEINNNYCAQMKCLERKLSKQKSTMLQRV